MGGRANKVGESGVGVLVELTPVCALCAVAVHISDLARVCRQLELYCTTQALTSGHDGEVKGC